MNYLLIYERRECYEDPEERGKMREKEREDSENIFIHKVSNLLPLSIKVVSEKV